MAMDEQLPHLDTFSKAADLGSFTAAAKALRLTQAAVSQRIQVFEKAIGKSLFLRTGGRVTLTEAGQTLLEYAQRIFELHREVRSKISGQEIPIAGALTLGASSIPGEHILPALLSTFHRTYPLIQVRAAISDSTTVVKQVERRSQFRSGRSQNRQSSLGFPLLCEGPNDACCPVRSRNGTTQDCWVKGTLPPALDLA